MKKSFLPKKHNGRSDEEESFCFFSSVNKNDEPKDAHNGREY
jgi:hypothetical protein